MTRRERTLTRLPRPTYVVAAAGLCLSSVLVISASGAARTPGHGSLTVTTSLRRPHVSATPLPPPAAVRPFQHPSLAGEGVWHPSGRLVGGHPAVYTTTVRLPGTSSVEAGIAWMDTRLLRATLYSGSLSPGGSSWKYSAPITPQASRTLVAAFSGGFLLKDSQGGYLSEGRTVAPLRVGGASLVIYRDGFATVGQWERDVSMTPNVVAVRQNLTLLVENGRPVPGLNPADIKIWGVALNGVVNTPRSGLGVTANGALVYVSGPMNIVDLAQLLVRAGAVRAMTLDMNPFWPVFATFTPSSVNGLASAANGKDLLSTMYQPPGRFYEVSYNRDFVTMSSK
ncbi:MAG TPA: phosphodiester glycosidase family protein [Acidimicrobiales bacterium]|nr:phosphodiester glycosidase family protein [Acidimicrobiales bacterium]